MNNVLTWILGLISAYSAIKWQTSSHENEILKQKLAEKKEKLYSQFIEYYMNLVKDKNNNKELENGLREINMQMLLTASNKVLLTYGDMMQLIYKTNGTDSKQMIRLLGELIVAMREDLGHKDFLNSVQWNDVVRPWMKDVDSIFPPKNTYRRFYSKNLDPK